MPVIHGVPARLLPNACAVAAKLLGFALSMKIHGRAEKAASSLRRPMPEQTGSA